MHIYLAQSQIGVCVVMQFSDVLERNTLLDVSHQNGFHYGLLFGHRVLITDGFLYGHRVLHGSGQRHHSAPPRLAPKAGTWDEELDKRVCLFAAHKRDGEAANNAAGMCDFDVLWNSDESAYEKQSFSFEKYERHGLWSSDEDKNEELDERDGGGSQQCSRDADQIVEKTTEKKGKYENQGGGDAEF